MFFVENLRGSQGSTSYSNNVLHFLYDIIDIWSLFIISSLLIEIFYFSAENLVVLVLCSILILDATNEKYHVVRQILLWKEIVVVFVEEGIGTSQRKCRASGGKSHIIRIDVLGNPK